MMDYQLTTMDAITILVLCGVVLALLLAWPRKDDPMSVTERFFVMGKNATRMGWDASTGHHEISLQLNRCTDQFPKRGDTLIIMESAGSEAHRYTVTDIQAVVQMLGEKPQVVVMARWVK